MKKIFNKILILITVTIASMGLMFAGAQTNINVPQVYNPTSNGSAPVGVQLNKLLITGQGLSVTLYGSLFVVALIVFFFGLFKFMFKGGDAESRKEGWKYMVFGIISITVMFCIYGLVYFLSGSFGIGIGGETPMPKPPTTRSEISS